MQLDELFTCGVELLDKIETDFHAQEKNIDTLHAQNKNYKNLRDTLIKTLTDSSKDGE